MYVGNLRYERYPVARENNTNGEMLGVCSAESLKSKHPMNPQIPTANWRI
jgi:hypothetical protein